MGARDRPGASERCFKGDGPVHRAAGLERGTVPENRHAGPRGVPEIPVCKRRGKKWDSWKTIWQFHLCPLSGAAQGGQRHTEGRAWRTDRPNWECHAGSISDAGGVGDRGEESVSSGTSEAGGKSGGVGGKRAAPSGEPGGWARNGSWTGACPDRAERRCGRAEQIAGWVGWKAETTWGLGGPDRGDGAFTGGIWRCRKSVAPYSAQAGAAGTHGTGASRCEKGNGRTRCKPTGTRGGGERGTGGSGCWSWARIWNRKSENRTSAFGKDPAALWGVGPKAERKAGCRGDSPVHTRAARHRPGGAEAGERRLGRDGGRAARLCRHRRAGRPAGAWIYTGTE